MTLPDEGKGITLGGLLLTLKDVDGKCPCRWHIVRSSEHVDENATHRTERVFRRLVVSIDLPEVLVRLALPGAKR